jgi:hypothetical protein
MTSVYTSPVFHLHHIGLGSGLKYRCNAMRVGLGIFTVAPQRTPQHTPPRVPIPRLDLTPQSLKLANGKPVVLPQNVDDDSGSSSWSSSGSSSVP